MPTACLNQPDCRVSIVRERLEIRGRRDGEGSPDQLLREIPLRDPAFALQIAGRIVTSKLYNQRRVLQRLLAGRELRGHEGAASARYFQAWATFLPDTFPFERRSRRRPLNPVNACISFGATIIYQESVAFLHAHGLDPALGLLHTTENGRWSLALDLIEPFRPALDEDARVARVCEDYGIRVQYSVFECRLEESDFDTFWLRLLEEIDEAEDRLVDYKIDARCARDTLTAGTMVCSEKVLCYLV